MPVIKRADLVQRLPADERGGLQDVVDAVDQSLEIKRSRGLEFADDLPVLLHSVAAAVQQSEIRDSR